ncbi:MAG: DUF6316 family protein [Pseudomonadota bacterium]
MRKSDDSTKVYPRGNDRVVSRDGAWFVKTREGLRGPFTTREAAEKEADSYAETMEYLKDHPATVESDLDLSNVEIIDMDADKPRW